MARPRSTSADAIIDTAAQLFLDRGFHKTSIEDVAEAAGISKPTVYTYVKSKQWLLDQIILRVINDLSTVLEPWRPSEERDLTEQLDAYLDFHIDRATHLRVFYHILFSEETEMSVRVRRKWYTFASDVTEHFTSLLELYRRDGRVQTDADLAAVSNFFIPALVSLHRWYRPAGPVSPDDVRELAKQFLGGIIDL
ncbi:TetR/AcrR family transcriptional regulator [Aeromicrobium sp. CTD01-1L150]|uniref:TetR/AcrR family transcriptional regulator n=1 Tax=Aeromicrobium sp. CTD01-1L150 TaxID=3341830 RepID=UPI0035BF2097